MYRRNIRKGFLERSKDMIAEIQLWRLLDWDEDCGEERLYHISWLSLEKAVARDIANNAD